MCFSLENTMYTSGMTHDPSTSAQTAEGLTGQSPKTCPAVRFVSRSYVRVFHTTQRAKCWRALSGNFVIISTSWGIEMLSSCSTAISYSSETPFNGNREPNAEARCASSLSTHCFDPTLATQWLWKHFSVSAPGGSLDWSCHPTARWPQERQLDAALCLAWR